MTKNITTTLLVLFIIGTIYWYRDAWSAFLFPVVPCAKPLTYSIGEYDKRFGITEEKFIETIESAEMVWEDAMGKELFTYTETGKMKVNLAYDYRQEATEQLSDIGSDIDEGKASYEKLKRSYEVMTREYEQKKAAYEKASIAFDKDKKAYDEEVSYWNDRGGAPQKEYQELKEEGQELNKRAETINTQAENLNSLSVKANNTAAALNDLAKKLNIKVATFNTIGASAGEEFNEGEYVRDEEGTRINVYQFETIAQLKRLLEHELGHALGLDHVDDPDAIMYRLNSSENEELTEADIVELKLTCAKS